MKIELTCACGAQATFESGAFINGGGRPDERGRVYVVELRAEEWQEKHEGHKRPYHEPTLTELGTIAELTRGVGGASPDGTSQTKVTGA